MKSKVPVVKAKAGPRIMTFMCDDKLFDNLPVKQEVKAMVGGIYIMSFKGPKDPASAEKKKGFLDKIKSRFS